MFSYDEDYYDDDNADDTNDDNDHHDHDDHDDHVAHDATCLLATPGEALGCSNSVTVAWNHREVVADERALMMIIDHDDHLGNVHNDHDNFYYEGHDNFKQLTDISQLF